jgi:AcrR family transcriptional regulator
VSYHYGSLKKLCDAAIEHALERYLAVMRTVARVGIDPQRGLGPVEDLHAHGDDLKAAQVDHRVVQDLAGDPHRRLQGDAFELAFQRVALAAASVGHLCHARVVADQDELHRALQAQGVHPAGDRNGLANVFAQVGDQYACCGVDHRSPPADLG